MNSEIARFPAASSPVLAPRQWNSRCDSWSHVPEMPRMTYFPTSMGLVDVR